MEIVLRGVRGSTPVPSPAMSFYGGNTSCVEVCTDDGSLLFFDAGTGLREGGDGLPPGGVCHLFISHAHTDHIQGLGFFAPLHSPLWTTHIYLPAWIEGVLDTYFSHGMFPIPFRAFQGHIVRTGLEPGQMVCLGRQGDVVVEALAANHPGGALAYRLRADGAVFLYSGDHEITDDKAVRQTTEDMLCGTDLAVVDAMYSRSDYRPGWGHSCWEDWRDIAREAGAGDIIFSHHAPDRTDCELDRLQKTGLAESRKAGQSFSFAREGLRISLPRSVKLSAFSRESVPSSAWLDDFLDGLALYQDENTLLDRILLKAREIARADAGTIFLAEGQELLFAYTHNDSLFSVDTASKYAYSSSRLPIDDRSIAGFVALTGQTLNLPDVRSLPSGVPYSFREDYDKATGYHTRSMLVIPFYDRAGRITGVLQLINSLDARSGLPRAFTHDMERHVRVLAREIANILERSSLVRSGIYRLIRLAAVHDPTETGPHAERVGAIAAEIFQLRANKLGLDPDETRHVKSLLRMAAMLHDIGKVGVSDLLLKKKGKLSDEEFAVMREHTRLGAEILESDPLLPGARCADGGYMAYARDIALHHHQKWNGQGYAGAGLQGRLAGEDIPLSARITAIADVFDALVSPRSYKEPWTHAAALEVLRRDAGSHFDPFLVQCMAEMMDVVERIYQRFPDTPQPCGGPVAPAGENASGAGEK